MAEPPNDAYNNLMARAQDRIDSAVCLQNNRLALNGLRLTAIPPEVFEMKWLHELDLSDNCLTVIPTDITKLTFLKKLNVSNNRLSDIPLDIVTLPWLCDLRVSLNANLPNELKQLSRQGFPALMQHLRVLHKKRKDLAKLAAAASLSSLQPRLDLDSSDETTSAPGAIGKVESTKNNEKELRIAEEAMKEQLRIAEEAMKEEQLRIAEETMREQELRIAEAAKQEEENRKADEELRRVEEEESRRVEEARENEIARRAEESKLEEMKRIEEEQKEERRIEELKRDEEMKRIEEERKEEEAKREERRKEEEEAKREEERRRAEEEAEERRREEEAKRVEEARRVEEEAKRVEEARRVEEEETKRKEGERREEERKKAEEEAEERREEEEAKREEEARRVEEEEEARREEETKRKEEEMREEEEEEKEEARRVEEEETKRAEEAKKQEEEEEEAIRIQEETRREKEEREQQIKAKREARKEEEEEELRIAEERKREEKIKRQAEKTKKKRERLQRMLEAKKEQIKKEEGRKKLELAKQHERKKKVTILTRADEGKKDPEHNVLASIEEEECTPPSPLIPRGGNRKEGIESPNKSRRGRGGIMNSTSNCRNLKAQMLAGSEMDNHHNSDSSLSSREKMILLSLFDSQRRMEGTMVSLSKVLLCIIRVQTFCRAFLARKRVSRIKAEKKIIETESLLLGNLETLVNEIIVPLQETNVLSPIEFFDIFSVFRDIILVQQELIRTLREAFKTDIRVAVVYATFYSQPDVLNLYKQYASDYALASQSLQRSLSSNHAFANFLKETHQKHLCGKEDILNYLSQPIESIARCGLLLHTLKSRSLRIEYPLVQEAIDKLNAIDVQIQDAVQKEGDKFNYATKLQKEFWGKTTTDLWHQQLLQEGQLVWHKEGDKKKESKEGGEQVYVFLFDRSLVITEKKSKTFLSIASAEGQYKVLGQFQFGDIQLQSKPDEPPPPASEENVLSIVLAIVKKKYALVAKTWKDKEIWIDSLHKAISKMEHLRPSTGRKPESHVSRDWLMRHIRTKDKEEKEKDKKESFIKRISVPKNALQPLHINVVTPMNTMSPRPGQPLSISAPIVLQKDSGLSVPKAPSPTNSPRRESPSPPTLTVQSVAATSNTTTINLSSSDSQIPINTGGIVQTNVSASGKNNFPNPNPNPKPTRVGSQVPAADGTKEEKLLLLLEKPNLLPEEGIEDEKQLKRNKCINEIITTERDYIRDLELLNEHFREPIKQKKLLNEKEISDMFSNIMLLSNLNKELFLEIQEQLTKNPSSPEIAPTFLSFSDFLKMYSAYCMNQAKALGKLKSISREMTHPELREFLVQKYQSLDTGVFTLRSYLIKPVQRVCKYPLFLKELMKHTLQEHPDYQRLLEALKRIEVAVTSIEQNTRSLENIEKIAEIQSRIEGGEKLGLVEPTRRFLKEGLLKEIQIKGKEIVGAEDVFYYLFNDTLVRAAPEPTKKGKFRRMITIGRGAKTMEEKLKLKSKVLVTEISISDYDDTLTEKLSFLLNYGEEKHVVVASSLDEKTAWVGEINKAIQERDKSKAAAPNS